MPASATAAAESGDDHVNYTEYPPLSELLESEAVYRGTDGSSTSVAAGTVECYMAMDNTVMEVYADGVKLELEGWTTEYDKNAREAWESYSDTLKHQLFLKRATFNTSVQVLGVSGWDGEIGCDTGGLAMMCVTNDASDFWHGVTTTAGSAYTVAMGTGWDTRKTGTHNATMGVDLRGGVWAAGGGNISGWKTTELGRTNDANKHNSKEVVAQYFDSSIHNDANLNDSQVVCTSEGFPWGKIDFREDLTKEEKRKHYWAFRFSQHPCEAGTSGDNGIGPCTECPAGSWSNASASECVVCAAGQFTPDAATPCQSCDPGYVTGTLENPGASKCTKCPVYTRNAASTTPCEALVGVLPVKPPLVLGLTTEQPEPLPSTPSQAVQAAAKELQAGLANSGSNFGGISFSTDPITVSNAAKPGDLTSAMSAIAANAATSVAATNMANNLAKQVLASSGTMPKEVVSKTAAELATFNQNVVNDFVSELRLVPGAPTELEKTALQITMEAAAAKIFINGEFLVPQVALNSRGSGQDAMALALADYFNAASLFDARAALDTVAAKIPMTEGYAAEQGDFWQVWLETLELQAQFKATLNAIDAERARVLSVLARWVV